MKAPLSRRTLFLVSFSTRRFSNSGLRIAHFSTYHNQSQSHYSSRRQEEDVRNVKVSVWWDVESCSLPVGGSSGYKVGHSITAALRANGIKGPLQITAFGNVLKLPRWTQEALSSTGITLTHVPGGKDIVNRTMIIELMYWVSQHPPPVHIFLISGDSDMASILHRLRMSNYNILLAGPEDPSTALCSAASIMWQWNTLVKGENLVGKHFNQPPDGPTGSWYGAFRGPIESPFPAVEQALPTRNSEPAESENENTVHDIPTEVTEQIQRILTTYPKGVSLATLRTELSSNMIVDKKLYGYKKFSSLLLAMPQILKLHKRADGQHLVCAVRPKAQVSTDSPMDASENSIAGNTNHRTHPNQVEEWDGNSYLKSADELCTLNSRPETHVNSKPIEPDHRSSPLCNEQQPSPKEGCEGPPTNDKAVEAGSSSGSAPTNDKAVGAGSSSGSAPTKKQECASKDGFFRRTWTKWFGDANDAAVKREGNHSVQHGSSSHFSSICDAAPDRDSDKFKNSDGGVGGILKFCSQLLYGFKTDSIESESAAAETYLSNISSQVAQHSLRNDVFSQNVFWTEIKSFMRTPEGANLVSKSISRQQMARAMKNEGPSVLSSFGDDDLRYLVNLLIDYKKWIEECPSKPSPFKVIATSLNLPGNSNDPNAMSSTLSDEPQKTDLQKQRECGTESANQVRSRIIESSEERKTRMLADCQKLLYAVLKSHPGGYKLSGFKKLFFERYCYCLQVRSLEFDKLSSLISTMSGVKLKDDVIFPSENFSSTPESSDIDLLADKNRIRQVELDNEMSVPSTHSESSDSQFDEQLGPVRSLHKNVPSSLIGNLKTKTDRPLLQYEPCSEEDIYTDSDGETQTKEGRVQGRAPKVHNEVSTLIDILSNWEARKDGVGASNSHMLETATAPKDNLQNPIRSHSMGEVSRKSSKGNVTKWKPPRTFNFVSEDHKKVELKSTAEPRHEC